MQLKKKKKRKKKKKSESKDKPEQQKENLADEEIMEDLQGTYTVHLIIWISHLCYVYQI